MAVISVSIPDSVLREIDKRVVSDGYSSRSELIRAALESFLAGGEPSGSTRIIVVLSDHSAHPRVDVRIMENAYRAGEDLQGLYHQVLSGERCLTVIVMREGPAAGAVTQALRRLKGVKRLEVLRA